MAKTERVLIVEDSLPLAQIYKAYLSKTDFDVNLAETVDDAIHQIKATDPSIILLDVELPDGSGIDLLEFLKQENHAAQVVVMTAHGSSEMAHEAIKVGAVDFLTKPFDAARLIKTIESALALKPVEKVQKPVADEPSCFALLGDSSSINDVRNLVVGLSNSVAPCLLASESGVDRQEIAQYIHNLGDRRHASFTTIDCALISDQSMLSTLCGAQSVLKACDGGTLFIDNVNELATEGQKLLLGFLKTSSFVSLETDQAIQCDVRLIAGVVGSLEECVQQAKFREDLFYQLSVVSVDMPSLSQRDGDVITIATAILKDFAKDQDKAFNDISADAAAVLQSYDWPGGVQELQNTLYQVVIVHDGVSLMKEMLPKKLLLAHENQLDSSSGSWSNLDVHQLQHFRPDEEEEIKPLWLIEKTAIEQAILVCGGNINRAASFLEVAPSTIYRKVQMWNKNESQQEVS